ncbi:MAG TPA: CRISPR-associated endonuclease Cas2 [Blastocatellia bacterium]|nr:CRISPR-associated endonuclease Cas2 [Blastocatellia bacterium]
MAVTFVIAAYDIADEKRLRKVAAMMEDYGTRVQRSVFECLLPEEKLMQLVREIETLIHPQQDTVRLYWLCGACRERVQIYGLGQLTADPDVFIL